MSTARWQSNSRLDNAFDGGVIIPMTYSNSQFYANIAEEMRII